MDGEEGLNYDNIIQGPTILYVLLTLVFNSILVHGYNPDSMLVGTMVAIQKDKRQLACTSVNFRAVTLSSIVAKLFDGIILSKEHYVLATPHFQFGFKQNMPTTHCRYVMMETISHYNVNGSTVYALILAKLSTAFYTFYQFTLLILANHHQHVSVAKPPHTTPN